MDESTEIVQLDAFQVLTRSEPRAGGKLMRVDEQEIDRTSRIQHSTIICGNAKSTLAKLEPQSVQAAVTSPPYWGLRDYGIENQIGLENSVDKYIQSLVSVFNEVKRVLKDDGTLWINIGDSYTSGGRTWRAPDKKNPARAMSIRPPTPEGLKPKDLIGIPWRLAFALQRAGWYLRTEIIWNKPNCQPESVRDRPTRSHEYLFLFSKSERYYYDVNALRGPNGRRIRTVWNVNTSPIPNAHFATFPIALIKPCILTTSHDNDFVLDPFLGSGTTGLAAIKSNRRFIGIELNPRYCAMAMKRIQGKISHE